MEITRRRFLGLTGAASGLALLPVEFDELLAAVAQSERQWPGPGLETWVNSVCQLCPGGCGIRVRLLDRWPARRPGGDRRPVPGPHARALGALPRCLRLSELRLDGHRLRDLGHGAPA